MGDTSDTDSEISNPDPRGSNEPEDINSPVQNFVYDFSRKDGRRIVTPKRLNRPYTQTNEQDAVPSTSRQPDFPPEVIVDTDSDEDEEVDGKEKQKEESRNKKRRFVNENMVSRIINIFPQISPDYIRSVCRNKEWHDVDQVITEIKTNKDLPQWPQRFPSPPLTVEQEEQLEIVKALLPDADPTFLRKKYRTIGNDNTQLNEWICSARENRNYPSKEEYLRKQKLSDEIKQYTTDFDPERVVHVDECSYQFIIHFFRNEYRELSISTIKTLLSVNNYRIMDSARAFSAFHGRSTCKPRPRPLCDYPSNIMILQELAYVSHKEEIDRFIAEKKAKEEVDRQHAKENGLMSTCQCCFDEEILPKDTLSCPKGCQFCRTCIQKSCEVAFGEGKTEYKCLSDCSEEFTVQVLQDVLPPKMFSKLTQKKTLAEIKAAGIEGLETCPFCDFASIPNETDKIFRCLNPDCMKESCRLCKERNHVPYKCDEVEKDSEVKARIYLENKMSEALVRKCWKCGISFFKEEGCNKMTCTCGAKMCYLCKKPVTGYDHFNGIGGDKFHLCPLYSDSNEVNKKNVIEAAEAAKAEIDRSKLKFDPTSNIEEHFEERRRALPREAHLEILEEDEDEEEDEDAFGGLDFDEDDFENHVPGFQVVEPLLNPALRYRPIPPAHDGVVEPLPYPADRYRPIPPAQDAVEEPLVNPTLRYRPIPPAHDGAINQMPRELVYLDPQPRHYIHVLPRPWPLLHDPYEEPQRNEDYFLNAAPEPGQILPNQAQEIQGHHPNAAPDPAHVPNDVPLLMPVDFIYRRPEPVRRVIINEVPLMVPPILVCPRRDPPRQVNRGVHLLMAPPFICGRPPPAHVHNEGRIQPPPVRQRMEPGWNNNIGEPAVIPHPVYPRPELARVEWLAPLRRHIPPVPPRPEFAHFGDQVPIRRIPSPPVYAGPGPAHVHDEAPIRIHPPHAHVHPRSEPARQNEASVRIQLTPVHPREHTRHIDEARGVPTTCLMCEPYMCDHP